MHHLPKDNTLLHSMVTVFELLFMHVHRKDTLNLNDELWMVIDLDRWHNKDLSDVASKCNDKNYKLAVSNPCFEIWLLLHVKDISDYSEEKIQKLSLNKNKILDSELRKILGSYNRANLDTSKFLPHVVKAVERARKFDEEPNDRWPQSIGTKIFSSPFSKIINIFIIFSALIDK